jgi:hypothetical protein
MSGLKVKGLNLHAILLRIYLYLYLYPFFYQLQNHDGSAYTQQNMDTHMQRSPRACAESRLRGRVTKLLRESDLSLPHYS